MCDILRKILEVNILNLIFNKLSMRCQLYNVHLQLSKYHQICDLCNNLSWRHKRILKYGLKLGIPTGPANKILLAYAMLAKSGFLISSFIQG